MTATNPAPRVSVLMTTYNGAKYIRDSIDSVLAQSYRDFELVIVDDNSADATVAIVTSYADPRLRLLRNPVNLGVVGARNRGFASLRGDYVATIDHDDLWLPERLQAGVACLERHPGSVLVATHTQVLGTGSLRQAERPRHISPALFRWMMLLECPVVYSSLLFRRAAATRADGSFLRPDLRYADDYELMLRLSAAGRIEVLDEALTRYRLHSTNTTWRVRDEMFLNAVKMLSEWLAPWLGRDAAPAARLIVWHISRGNPAADLATLRKFTASIQLVLGKFLENNQVSEADYSGIIAYTRDVYWRLLRTSLRSGRVWLVLDGWNAPRGPASFRHLGGWSGTLGALAAGAPRMPLCLLPSHTKRMPPSQPPFATAAAFANAAPAALPGTGPVCAVLIDAEEDFDWQNPVRGVAHDVGCMRHLGELERVLAAHRAVPTYLLTYPVLQDAAIVAALRERVAGGQCRVGVQLHPWVTPPFEETAELRHSFAGNLPVALEERKLLELMRLFRAGFGENPVIFRAGRYGLGLHTPELLEKHGFLIDTSLAPNTSFAEEGGPDFSATDYGAFWFGRSRRLLELPLCRGIAGWGGRPAARAYRKLAEAEPRGLTRVLPSLLAWTRCAERITLSPEGNDTEAVQRLAASLLRRGQRVLALSLHSSSLSPGHNPYVRDAAEQAQFYARLSAILDMLASRHAVRFVAAEEIPGLLGNQ